MTWVRRVMSAVLVAVVFSWLPWWFDTNRTPAAQQHQVVVETPARKALQQLGASVATDQEAANMLRVLHTNGAYHQPELMRLTGLCRKNAATTELYQLDATTLEQTLPSGMRVLRTDNIFHWTHSSVAAVTAILDSECDIGSFYPLEVTAEYIYWSQPCERRFSRPNEEDAGRKQMIACYQLAVALGK